MISIFIVKYLFTFIGIVFIIFVCLMLFNVITSKEVWDVKKGCYVQKYLISEHLLHNIVIFIVLSSGITGVLIIFAEIMEVIGWLLRLLE